MLQSKGKGGPSRAGSTRPETKAFVPDDVRVAEDFPERQTALASPPPRASSGLGMARQSPRKPHETVPFVSDTVRMSPLSLPVGGNPTQARPTPLPKPGLPLAGKKSLLHRIAPRLGRNTKQAGAGALREPTLEVSDQDISILESSTHELSLDEVSQLDAPLSSLPPPIPSRTPRRQSPWLMWGLVGAAWCVMIGLALLAVEPDASELADQNALPAPVGAASAPDTSVESAASTRVVAPTPSANRAPAPEATSSAAAPTAAPENSTKTSVGARVGEGEKKLKKARNSREKRVNKRSKHKAKAVSKKSKRAKKVRAARQRATERG